ncbi:hypothetical protein L1987_10792 [Smallanthus sonchifolius]|uniref:Uncharacterized protein n=1 Tax=Smallanthus sonchifolius TaxID=185202 RepID=A0ACB9JBC9_9ASTR|nr:hypothetical protein L1987_10792 [Smallanthus sonchifolius]
MADKVHLSSKQSVGINTATGNSNPTFPASKPQLHTTRRFIVPGVSIQPNHHHICPNNSTSPSNVEGRRTTVMEKKVGKIVQCIGDEDSGEVQVKRQCDKVFSCGPQRSGRGMLVFDDEMGATC